MGSSVVSASRRSYSFRYCCILLLSGPVFFSVFTAGRGQTDADPTPVDHKPHPSLFIIVGQLTHLRTLGCIGKQAVLHSGVVDANLCQRVFGVVINFSNFRLLGKSCFYRIFP
jgi:hypothetical protein